VSRRCAIFGKVQIAFCYIPQNETNELVWINKPQIDAILHKNVPVFGFSRPFFNGVLYKKSVLVLFFVGLQVLRCPQNKKPTVLPVGGYESFDSYCSNGSHPGMQQYG
jgi:hypothetical protein